MILGVGVAGLQAIATAKRLGAVIEASDVRPASRNRSNRWAPSSSTCLSKPTKSAKQRSRRGRLCAPDAASWMERQKAEVAKRVAQADIVITTALIPGRAAPVLVTEEMVKSMKPGSVIVDMAVEAGRQLPAVRSGQDRGQARRHPVRRGLICRPWWRQMPAHCMRATCLTSSTCCRDPKQGGAININREDDIIAGT